MCKCDPSIRTPFCRKGECLPPSEAKKPRSEFADWQLRVIEEKRELDERLQALCNDMDLFQYRALPDEDRKLLRDQKTHMERYSLVLEMRINRFKETQHAA